MRSQEQEAGLRAEVRLLVRRFVQVWALVPRKHKKVLALAAVILALTSASSTAIALVLGTLVDSVTNGLSSRAEPESLYKLAGGYLGLIAAAYLLREGLTALRRCLVETTCARISRDMSIRLMAHLLRVNLATLAGEQVGALHGRIFRSVGGYVRFLRLGFLDCLPAVFVGVFALAASTAKQPLLGLVMLGVIPISVWLTIRQLTSQKGVRLALNRDCEEIDGAVVEQLTGIEYLRAANTHKYEIRRLAEATEARRKREVQHHREMSLYGCAKALNEGLFHVLVLALAIFLAIQARVSAGDVLTFSVLFLSVMAPLSEVHRVLDEGHEASLNVGELLEMLAEPIDSSFETARRSEPYLARGEPVIELDNLAVEYLCPQGQRVRALDGVSLAIRHGETIGVAGRSGGGKSTWIRVLLRLTHPLHGHARLGGVPMQEVSREAIGRLVGYVGQNPFVFCGTVAENIAYGNPHATRDEIERAARLAAIHDEILQLPGGYDTRVTEKGQNLSGGQRQRLAIARVLLKRPPILILDEATSALDNISERRVQRALGVRDPNRTTIVVAHRLSTLRDADRIFVFDAGRIAEVGTYDELLRQSGMFAKLVASAEKSVTADEEPTPESVPEADANPIVAESLATA